MEIQPDEKTQIIVWSRFRGFHSNEPVLDVASDDEEEYQEGQLCCKDKFEFAKEVYRGFCEIHYAIKTSMVIGFLGLVAIGGLAIGFHWDINK